ncbi:MAG: tRNA 2-thiouridine(34) synthase MnmA [Desulfobulbaceae bacterium]|jgi:tRNA-specific 2-thiouridylase|nr:tRNA 2-thiouridine(34) synthase MnmA [Desulfobulbaceae bacterium]
MVKKTVGVALSGGVDSTMTAHILLGQGHAVVGFFMELAQPDLDKNRERAQAMATRLGIELRSVDLRQEFQRRVLNYLRAQYRRGLTPNPCLVCTREIKFGLLRRAMIDAGIDAMATGHYATIYQDDGPRLYKGVDSGKDQSYFLASLGREQLTGLLLPLGRYYKRDVVAMAAAQGFTGFPGESQDVCFLAGQSVGDFLANELDDSQGPILTTAGQEIGRHRGLFRYTIGQRRGLGLPDATPWYVLRLDPRRNTVIVGKDEELFAQSLTTSPVNWLRPPVDFLGLFTVRIRSNHAGGMARLLPEASGGLTIHFLEAQRAVAPGQFAVIYDHDEVLGSAVITASND